MRRLLLALVAAVVVLPTANASAAFITHDVRLSSFVNATDQPLTVNYDDSDPLTPPKTARVAPDGRLPVMSGDTVSLTLADCGALRLTFSNPLIGRPSATLDNRFDERGARFDVGDRRTLTLDGVRVAVARGSDVDGDKDFTVEVQACRVTPTTAMTPAPEMAPRATVRNATTQTVDVGTVDAGGGWRAVTIAPGATSPVFGADPHILQLLLSDCGPARVRIADFPNDLMIVQVWGTSWPWSDAPFGSVGAQRTFSGGGNQLTVTRVGVRQFAVDLVACGG
jgi:hypothetical protein